MSYGLFHERGFRKWTTKPLQTTASSAGPSAPAPAWKAPPKVRACSVSSPATAQATPWSRLPCCSTASFIGVMDNEPVLVWASHYLSDMAKVLMDDAHMGILKKV
ncbi:DUF3077 domain-containing protein [Pseudomonas mosselii]|uniref:DUF3077 domain-containing protein n=1 Tax=Pseudomonas mosselii TaxID=78327 RepID=UPI002867C628|nr:DUF3077 domain-containing protein [Pseudomonas mosselii]